MSGLESTLEALKDKGVEYRGFTVYNAKPDLLPMEDNAQNETYKPIDGRIKLIIAGSSLGGALVLGGIASSIPYPSDFAAIIGAPLLAFAGLASYMSYEQVKHPAKYDSFGEMMSHFKEDTEPKNRVYRYLKGKFGRRSKSVLEMLKEQRSQKDVFSIDYLDEKDTVDNTNK